VFQETIEESPALVELLATLPELGRLVELRIERLDQQAVVNRKYGRPKRRGPRL